MALTFKAAAAFRWFGTHYDAGDTVDTTGYDTAGVLRLLRKAPVYVSEATGLKVRTLVFSYDDPRVQPQPLPIIAADPVGHTVTVAGDHLAQLRSDAGNGYPAGNVQFVDTVAYDAVTTFDSSSLDDAGNTVIQFALGSDYPGPADAVGAVVPFDSPLRVPWLANEWLVGRILQVDEEWLTSRNSGGLAYLGVPGSFTATLDDPVLSDPTATPLANDLMTSNDLTNFAVPLPQPVRAVRDTELMATVVDNAGNIVPAFPWVQGRARLQLLFA